MAIELTDEQKTFIENNYKKITDLKTLTQKTFKNTRLDGRSREASLVKGHISKLGGKYKTTKKKSGKQITFTPKQKENIIQLANEGLSSLKIAEIIFADRTVKRLSAEQKAVHKVIKEFTPELLQSSETALGEEFHPPKNLGEALKLVNIASGQELEEPKLTANEREGIDCLIKFLSSPRLKSIIGSMASKEYRELFLYEFVRATWDKSDLTTEDVNLYINVCQDFINSKNITNHMEKLNQMLEEADDQFELKMNLIEALSTKSTEFNQCEKRMESLLRQLNTARTERLKTMRANNANILALVRAFQQEEERKRMLTLAKLQSQAVKDEIEKLENMDEWKARVMGIRATDMY